MLETAGLLAASFGAWSLVYAPRSCDKLVFEAMDGVRALPEGRESTAGGKMVRSRASEWSVRACSSLCASVLCKRVNRQLREMSTLPSRRLLTLSMHAGMQFAGGLTEQTATASSLKRRERSPSPRPCKVRPRVDLIQLCLLTSYTRSSGRIPAHSAESRRTTLRNSTPTPRQVSRGDGRSMPTAAETTPPARRRVRGPVRVWTGSGGHRNCI